ncbi:MAG: hypothetical protein RIE73_33565 [Coleofasciculus sp. C1-SOL-03]|uniref:hypothetical protein n=1 Tax=Coleofasciculus sp. C1-SOL-03 TaxID=3069522 RepID=UPI0032F35BD9
MSIFCRFCRTFVGTTLIPTVAEFDENVEPIRKPLMQNVEAMKIILEIIVIFLTFPEYAPLLALVVVLGTLYSLLNREDKGDK